MEDVTMYKLWLHEDDAEEARLIRVLDEYGRGRSRLISIALQDMMKRYRLEGKDREQLRKFVDNFEFISAFADGLEERSRTAPPAADVIPQKSAEELQKEEDKKAFGDLLSAFGGDSF